MTGRSERLLKEIEQGYIIHNGQQWKVDSKGIKRLQPHMPEVRYESPIKGHERRQFWRQLRKQQEKDHASNLP